MSHPSMKFKKTLADIQKKIDMRHFHFFQLCCLTAAVLTASCTGNLEETVTTTPELTVEEMQSAIPAEGGEFSVGYTLSDPSGNGKFSTYAEDGTDWIYNFSVWDGQISFEASPNDGVERSASVNVVYLYDGKSISASFTVTQEAGEGGEGSASFTFSFSRLSEMEASVEVTPSDPEITYTAMFIEKSEYDRLGSDKALFDQAMWVYRSAAAQYGMTLEEYLSSGNILAKGKSVVSLTGMKPDNEYYVFAAGTSFAGEMTTGISKLLFKTKSVDFINMSFAMNASVDGPVVYMTILPDNTLQRYVFDVVKSSTIRQEDILKFYQDYISQTIKSYQSFGLSTEEAVKQISTVGNIFDYKMELDPEYGYYGFAMAIRDDGLLVSEPVVIQFNTGRITPSLNEISISVTSLKPRSAEYEISASNDDPYIVVTGKASDWEGMEDDLIISNILGQDFPPEPQSGNAGGSMSQLQPGTEYVIYAFGTVAGYANTRLFSCRFTTPEAQTADVGFSLEIDKYFDGDQVEEVYPELYPFMAGKAVVPATAVASGDGLAGYYYHVFYGDVTDPSGSNYADDEYIYSSLMSQGHTSPGTIFYLDYGRDFTFVGFAYDQNGNFGPVYRKVMRFSRDGVSPVDEFMP